MNKKRNFYHHLLMKLNLGLIISVISFSQLLAENSTQNVKINLNLSDVALKEVVEEIEKSTRFVFFFNNSDVDMDKKVSINANDSDIKSVLKQILPFNKYQINNYKIVLLSSDLQNTGRGEQSDKFITGVVTDKKTGETIIGATIMVKGTTNGVSTDIDGAFSIKVKASDVLVISYIGYNTKELNVGANNVLNVQLDEDVEALEEVVVIGYGAQKKVNLTGAVATASQKDLQNKATTNILDGLQGVIPNFNITSTSGGDPFDRPKLNIRGIGTLNEDSDGDVIDVGLPLVVIDGVQSDAYMLSRMNMEDVENISVLQDAASSAIYGARAAFGVILVTTKSGRKNAEKVSITFSSSLIIANPMNVPKPVNTYDHAVTVNEALRRAGDSPRFSEEHVEAMRLYHEDPFNNPIESIGEDGNYYFFGTIDYIDETLNTTAIRSRNNVNVSGGTKLSDYYLSAGWTSDEGYFKFNNQEIDVYSIKAKVNTDITKWLSVGLNTDFILDKRSEPNVHGQNLWDMIYGQRQYFNIINPMNGFYTHNPIQYLKSGATDIHNEANNVLTFSTKITPLKNWTIYGSYTYKAFDITKKEVAKKLFFSDNFGYRFPVSATKYNGNAKISSVKEISIDSRTNIYDIYTNYSLDINEDHDLGFTLGFNQEDFYRNEFSAKRDDMINDNIPSLDLTDGEDYVSQGAYHWSTRGAFYRVNYAYKGRYLFETNGRYDGTSRFPTDTRFGFFPSFSGAWRIGEESFMDWADKLDELKMRVSWGSLGNQNVSTYAYIASMGSSNVDYLFDGERPIGIKPPGLVADDLTWETVQTLNFGLDFGLFNNRLTGTFNYFIRDTYDMLVAGDAVPGILGASAPARNVADLQTKGWDLKLNWRENIGDFSYGAGLVLSDSRTFITRYDNPTRSFAKARYEGEEYGEIWGYETEGFIQTEEQRDMVNSTERQQFLYSGTWKLGDIMYKDLNGDGKIDKGETNTVDDSGDRKIIGNRQARYNFGVNLDFAWKNFAIAAFFQGTMKRDFVPEGYLFFPYADTWRSLMDYQVGQSWTPETPDAYFPQMEGRAKRNYENQTKYLQNAAYIRLKNLSLSYSLSKELLEKLSLGELRFSVSGRNLWHATNLREPYDPESFSVAGTIFPYKREISFGLTVGF